MPKLADSEAIVDWVGRLMLSWRLSNTMDPAFCLDMRFMKL